jgi:hypothetical protein
LLEIGAQGIGVEVVMSAEVDHFQDVSSFGGFFDFFAIVGNFTRIYCADTMYGNCKAD